MKQRSSLMHSFILSGFLVMAALISCNPTKKLEDYEAEEEMKIQRFLSDHDTIAFERKTSGLFYYNILEGTGPQAETHDTAYMFYIWQMLSGEIYETNIGTTDTLIFPVNEGKLLTLGFDEAVTYMKEGGKAISLVPSSLAFGSSGQYFLPYTPFIFQTYLVKLVKH